MNPRLRQGVGIMLDGNPNERKKVYQLWGVENREEHYLQPTTLPEGQPAVLPQILAATDRSLHMP